MNSIAAIVVTYNRKELLHQCIAGLQAQTCGSFDIWIIDNASTDGTEASLAPLVERGEVIYRNTGSNLGGAGGFNHGIRAAVQAGYDHLWIMDDDTVPKPTALRKLMDAGAKCPGYGYLSSRTLWIDGSICRMNVQRDLRMGNIADFSQPLIPSGAATFVSLLLPARVVLDVGLPISDFFIWADDLEYTRRISRKYPCRVVTDSVVVHHCATNNGGNISTDEESRIDRYRYAYRNEVYIYRREGMRGLLRLLARTPLHILRVLRFSKSKKLRRIGVILGSTLRGIAFHPAIETVDPASVQGKEETSHV